MKREGTLAKRATPTAGGTDVVTNAAKPQQEVHVDHDDDGSMKQM